MKRQRMQIETDVDGNGRERMDGARIPCACGMVSQVNIRRTFRQTWDYWKIHCPSCGRVLHERKGDG